jgi:hypothetical protein
LPQVNWNGSSSSCEKNTSKDQKDEKDDGLRDREEDRKEEGRSGLFLMAWMVFSLELY